ncbi:MAG: Hpt domain-containing protein [Phycisphaerales bacterium]
MPTNPNNLGNPDPIASEFAGDPDMQEIITMFLQEMPDRVEQLQRLWRDSEFDQVKRIAHQLKGAGGGYGYPSLGAAAGALESSLNSLLNNTQGANLQSIRAQLDSLIDLCNRVS